MLSRKSSQETEEKSVNNPENVNTEHNEFMKKFQQQEAANQQQFTQYQQINLPSMTSTDPLIAEMSNPQKTAYIQASLETKLVSLQLKKIKLSALKTETAYKIAKLANENIALQSKAKLDAQKTKEAAAITVTKQIEAEMKHIDHIYGIIDANGKVVREGVKSRFIKKNHIDVSEYQYEDEDGNIQTDISSMPYNVRNEYEAQANEELDHQYRIQNLAASRVHLIETTVAQEQQDFESVALPRLAGFDNSNLGAQLSLGYESLGSQLCLENSHPDRSLIGAQVSLSENKSITDDVISKYSFKIKSSKTNKSHQVRKYVDDDGFICSNKSKIIYETESEESCNEEDIPSSFMPVDEDKIPSNPNCDYCRMTVFIAKYPTSVKPEWFNPESRSFCSQAKHPLCTHNDVLNMYK